MSAAALLFTALLATAAPNEIPAEPPHRIVTLAPSCAEVIAGLGLADRVVGVTDYTDWPERMKAVPKVGSYVDFSVEAVAALHPDLVVATDDGNPPAALHMLERLGIPVFTMHLRRYAEIERSILALGEDVRRDHEALRIVREMERITSCVANRTRNAARPRVLFLYEIAPLVSAGPGTFTDDLIEIAGATSITHAAATSFPRLSIETIIARAPDVVIVTGMDPEADARRIAALLRQWTTVPAERQKRIYAMDSAIVDRPSQRIVLGLVRLARMLHPLLFAHGECRPELP